MIPSASIYNARRGRFPARAGVLVVLQVQSGIEGMWRKKTGVLNAPKWPPSWYNVLAKKTRTMRLLSQGVTCYNRLSHPWCGLRVFLADSTRRAVTRGVLFLGKNLPTMTQDRCSLPNYRRVWIELTEIFGANCVYCHKQTATQIDHVIPYSYIHTHMMANLRPCCAWCNLLASDKVFEGFDEKYNFLRAQRNKASIQRNRMLTCGQCLIPYYSALHNHAWLCLDCYDMEYESESKRGLAWKKWIKTLSLAGFEIDAHRNLGKILAKNGAGSVHRSDKVSLLVECYGIARGQAADGVLGLIR